VLFHLQNQVAFIAQNFDLEQIVISNS